MFVLFFVFKQKTAYEMRISDWSSDVCSSDLTRTTRWPPTTSLGYGANLASRTCANSSLPLTSMPTVNPCPYNAQRPSSFPKNQPPGKPVERHAGRTLPDLARSEEHTSELQSLMRISYAVFCLKKKKKKQ